MYCLMLSQERLLRMLTVQRIFQERGEKEQEKKINETLERGKRKIVPSMDSPEGRPRAVETLKKKNSAKSVPQ
jgi:hypothetical protein